MLRHAVLLFAVSGLIANAEDWPRFRGPSGLGVATDSDSLPTTWSPNANLAWKAALPGPGASSPIIVGGKVFVTCYSGYGESRENIGKIENLMRHLVCIDMKSGDKVWQKDVPAAQPEDKYEGAGVPAHGYASHTPVSDGKHVYVFYGKSGVRAYDMDGNEKWYAEVGKETDPMKWGSSCSPVLHENLLIVTAAAESQSIIGFDKTSGKEVWRQEAEGLDNTWGTPALVKAGHDRTDLVMFVTGEVWGMDPATGKLRWHAEKATEAPQAYSSIVQHGKRVFAVTGRGGGSLAVDAGGKGAVETVWKGRDSASYASPVLHEDKLYSVASNIVTVIDANTGERLDQVRIKGSMGGRGDYPSPIVVGSRLYHLNGKGQMFVFSLGDKVKQEAVSRVSAEEGENFWGTPAVSDGRMLFRSSKYLYCVTDKGETVSDEDMKLAMAKGEPQGGQNDPMRFFKMLDTDSDGKVTMEEIEGNQRFGSMADRLKTLDKDTDGTITADEYRENIGALMRRGGGGRGGRGGRGGGRGGYGGEKDTRPDRPQRPKSYDK